MTEKLPIPRVRRERRDIIQGRTSRACETCRERKSKCDGVIPTCSQCVAQGLENCFYPERKVIRQEKEIASLRSEIKYYRKLLRNISHEDNGSNTFKVNRAIRVSPDALRIISVRSILTYQTEIWEKRKYRL